MSKILALLLLVACVLWLPTTAIAASETDIKPLPFVKPWPKNALSQRKDKDDPTTMQWRMASQSVRFRPLGRGEAKIVLGLGIAYGIGALIEENPGWSAILAFLAVGCGVAWIGAKLNEPNNAGPALATSSIATGVPETPPPTPASIELTKEWFVERPMGREGPCSVTEIRARLSNGTITSKTIVVSFDGTRRLNVAILIESLRS